MKKVLGTTLLVVALAGCGVGEAEQSVTTQTVTQTQTQAPVSTPEFSPTLDGVAVLEATWDQTSQEDKDNMCWGWGYDQEFMLESFFSEMDTGLVTRPEAIEFFDRKCGEL